MFNPISDATTTLVASLGALKTQLYISLANLLQVNWPYIIFPIAGNTNSDQEQIRDIETGATNIVPAPPTTLSSSLPDSVAYGIEGSSVIATWLTPDNQQRKFAQLDNPLTATSADDWKGIADITQPPPLQDDLYFSANPDLILFETLTRQESIVPNGSIAPTEFVAWDRRLNHLIEFPAKTLVVLNGKWLVFYPTWFQPNAAATPLPASMTLQLIDTSQLQVAQ